MAVEALLEGGRGNVHMASLPRRDGDFDVYVRREYGDLDAMAGAGLGDRARIWKLRETPDKPGEPLAMPLQADPLPEAGATCTPFA